MWTPQTQSLPSGPLPSVVKPTSDGGRRVVFEEPALLSDDETDCESDRGGDSLSSDDQALLASFIRLQQARARKAREAQPLTAPVAIPARQHAEYAPSCEEAWHVDEDDDDECPSCNECTVCWRREMRRFSNDHARLAAGKHGRSCQPQEPQQDADLSDLLFDLEM